MNNILLGVLIISGIVISSAFAMSSVSDISMASTQSGEVDIQKKSENIRAFYDGDKINVKNIGKYDSDIAMFRFFNSSGNEVHRVVISDDDKTFGTSLSVVRDTLLTSSNTHLSRHTLESFTLNDFNIDSFDGLDGEIVTKRGRVFPIVLETNPSTESNEGTGDGTSIYDALGVALEILNFNTPGKVYFGNGQIGSQTDIRQYVSINPNDDWAIVIEDSDEYETLLVPEFGKEYQYYSGSLIDVTSEVPHILGYSQSERLQGTNSVYLDSNGIHVSGTGMRILKLNPMEGVSMLYRTTIPSGASTEIVESPNDLILASYSNGKFTLYSETVSSPSTTDTFVAGTYRCGYHPSQHYYIYCDYYAVNYSGVEGYPMVYVKDNVEDSVTSSYSGYRTVRSTSNSIPIPQDDNIQTSTVGDYTLIERFSKSYSLGGIPAHITASFSVRDAEPYTSQLLSTTNSEMSYVMPSGDLYLIVKPNGGTVDIKGESFDPDSDVFFKVTNLPVNTAFDVSKSGITGVVGKTSETGEISLLLDDVDFGISSSPGGILKIYPESAKYLGDFGVGLIDLYNGYSLPLDTSDDLVYIPQNYVKWVFPAPVELTGLSIDDINLDALNRNYTKNDAVMIPVIPGAETIHVNINGTATEVLMRDVDVNTLIKQVPQKSSTSSDHSTTGVATATSNISTSTYLTVPYSGTANINLNLKVGGNADYTMDSSYAGGFQSNTQCKWHGASSPSRSYSCNEHSSPINQNAISNIQSLSSEHQLQLLNSISNGQVSDLTVSLVILKNMQSVGDPILIYSSDSAQASTTSTLSNSGYDSSNQVHITYPMTSVSENIEVPVEVGDMLEFIIIASLEAAGAPTPSSNDASYSSYVSVTTEFGGGLITGGMS